MTHSFDALVLGGGAAGLMCAIEAGKRGRRVAVLEHADRLGKKILISGGGRCNFTNLHCQPENFISSNPHFAKSALARYTPADFIALVEKHRIPYHEKTLGQLFCDRSARDILAMLEAECRDASVTIFLDTKIQQVERTTDFIVQSKIAGSENADFRAPALVVATGGLSIPKIGATSFGYDLARQFGIAIREPWPALVPLTLSSEDCSRYCDLAGVSAEVIASTTTEHGTQQFREKMLITHRGLSGPAILQISSYWKKPQPILIDLAPGRELTAAFRDPKTPRTLQHYEPSCATSSPIASPTAGSIFTLQLPGRIKPSPTWKNSRTLGQSRPPEPKATRKPSHRRRRRHRRTLRQNHGEPQGPRPVFHRRGRRRHRPSRRLQLSMGLVVRRRCRSRAVMVYG